MAGWATRDQWAGILGGLARSATAAVCACGLGACSYAIPSLVPDGDEMTTGSVAPKPKAPLVLDPALDPEDLRRARAALATALDPQGNGRPVKWDNPESGAGGAITADGSPYVADDLVCRRFLATVTGREAAPRSLRGSACRPAPEEWELREVKPWRKPAGTG